MTVRMERIFEKRGLTILLSGRFPLDIMRSVLQTAVAARAPLQEYILSVLRAPPAEVDATPTRFTPREWMAANTQPSPGG